MGDETALWIECEDGSLLNPAKVARFAIHRGEDSWVVIAHPEMTGWGHVVSTHCDHDDAIRALSTIRSTVRAVRP